MMPFTIPRSGACRICLALLGTGLLACSTRQPSTEATEPGGAEEPKGISGSSGREGGPGDGGRVERGAGGAGRSSGGASVPGSGASAEDARGAGAQVTGSGGALGAVSRDASDHATDGRASHSNGGSGAGEGDRPETGGGVGGAGVGSRGGGSAAEGGAGGKGGASVGSSGFSGFSGFSGSSGSSDSGSSAAGLGPSETKPQGYGRATTGGGSAVPVDVASLAACQAAIDDYAGSGGLVLKYTGTFDFSSITDPCTQHTQPDQTLEIKRKSDITILGADGSAANFGIHVASTASNIVIRNMTIGLTPGGSASDIISIEGMGEGFPTNIWIDHNTLFTALVECEGAGDTSFDGMIDVKKGADNVTVSYNYLHDHTKMSLNGYSDSDTAVRHITFHHNLIENVGSRTPLQRGGYSHLFNNYLRKVMTSGANIRMNGYSLIEANYFEDVKNPVTSRDSDAVGYWELRNNNLATSTDVAAGNGFGITWDEGNSGTVNATEWTTTGAYPVALGYDYAAHPFSCVHDGLRAVAGAGKGLATLSCK